LVVSEETTEARRPSANMRRMGKSDGRVSLGVGIPALLEPNLRRFHATFNFAKFRLMLLYPSAPPASRIILQESQDTGTLVERRPIQPKATLVEVSCYVLPVADTSTSQDKEVSCYV